MAKLNSLAGLSVYLDTNIFIYALEGLSPFAETAAKLVDGLDEGLFQGVTSELAVAECLVKPLELGLEPVVAMYDEFLCGDDHLRVVPITREVLVEAASIRARSRIGLPDAVHAASAIVHRCDRFVTNDDAFSKVPGLHVVKIGEFGL